MTLAEDDADAEFTPLGLGAEPCARVDRRVARTGHRVFRARDGFEVALPDAVREALHAFARAGDPNEWYGLLVGRRYADAVGRHVVVLGVVPDLDAAVSPSRVETSHASEYRTRRLAGRLFPGTVILGWVHSHVGCGARYSATDLRTQATWMGADSLGLVVDPWSLPDLALYRGPSAELLVVVPRPTGEVGDGHLGLGTPRTPAPGVLPGAGPVLRRPGLRRAWFGGRARDLARGVALVTSLGLGLGALRTVRGLRTQVVALDRRLHEVERRPPLAPSGGPVPVPARPPSLARVDAGPETGLAETSLDAGPDAAPSGASPARRGPSTRRPPPRSAPTSRAVPTDALPPSPADAALDRAE